MKKGYWVVRTYQAGAVGEKIKYWVEGEKPTRSARKIKQDIKKRQQNEASAEKQMARLLNANFRAGDILLGLDYSDEGLCKLTEQFDFTHSDDERELFFEAAMQELRLFLRRCRRALGDKMKYIAITSDMDGETGEEVRVHHHLVIPAEALEAVQGKWTLGGLHWEKLRDQKDYTPIAAYFVKQVRHIPDAKKYIPSRNLIRPQPKDRIAKSGAEIRPPRKSTLLYRAAYSPGMPQYIRYLTEKFPDATTHADVCAWEETQRRRRRNEA